LLVFIIRKSDDTETETAKTNLLLAAACIVGYFVAWGFYLSGSTNPWLLIIGIASLPTLFLVFIALWLKNYPVLIPAITFTIIHIATAGVGYF
jgi:hypothetical protein